VTLLAIYVACPAVEDWFLARKKKVKKSMKC